MAPRTEDAILIHFARTHAADPERRLQSCTQYSVWADTEQNPRDARRRLQIKTPADFVHWQRDDAPPLDALGEDASHTVTVQGKHVTCTRCQRTVTRSSRAKLMKTRCPGCPESARDAINKGNAAVRAAREEEQRARALQEGPHDLQEMDDGTY